MAKRVTGIEKRKARLRFRLKSCANGRLRLSVHRSGRHMYAQLIDDAHHKTVAASSTLEKDFKSEAAQEGESKGCAAARTVGRLLGERALKQNATKVVFDRGGYMYHGRIRVLADAARAAGLVF